MVIYTFNPGTGEAEMGRYLSSRPACFTQWALGARETHSQIKPTNQPTNQKTKTKNQKNKRQKNPKPQTPKMFDFCSLALGAVWILIIFTRPTKW